MRITKIDYLCRKKLENMIIRNRTTKTVEPSPLDNRGCAVPPDRYADMGTDPNGVAEQAAGAPLWGAYTATFRSPRVLATFVPSVIERRPRCGLVGGTIADNHIIL